MQGFWYRVQGALFRVYRVQWYEVQGYGIGLIPHRKCQGCIETWSRRLGLSLIEGTFVGPLGDCWDLEPRV